jgi:hypothetical protein
MFTVRIFPRPILNPARRRTMKLRITAFAALIALAACGTKSPTAPQTPPPPPRHDGTGFLGGGS